MSFWNQIDTFFTDSTVARQHSPIRKTVLFLVLFVLYTVLLSIDFLPDKVSLTLGQVSERDVVAPRTVSFVDEPRTRRLANEVVSSVANVYDLDTAAAATAEDDVSRIFRAVRSVVADGLLKKPTVRVAKLRSLLTGSYRPALVSLLSFSTAEMEQLEENARTTLRKYLYRGIRDEELDSVKKQAAADVEKLGWGEKGIAVLLDITQPHLRANFVLNQKETDQRKQAALKSIDPVRITVKSGQIVVRRGDVVTEEQMQMMAELGLHRAQVGMGRILGLSLYVLLVWECCWRFFISFLRTSLPMTDGCC